MLLNNNKIGLADAISLCEARSPPEQSSHAHCTVVITSPSRYQVLSEDVELGIDLPEHLRDRSDDEEFSLTKLYEDEESLAI